MVVDLEDERDLACELRHPRLDEAEGRRIRIAPGGDGELEVIRGIVARRIDGKAPRGPVLEALVDGEDDEATGAGQAPMVQEARQVGAGAGTVAGIPGEDFANAGFHSRAVLSLCYRR